MTATLPEASRLVDLYPAFRTPTRRPTRWNVRWPSPTPTPWSAVARLIERADWLDETVATLDSPIVTTGSGPEESPGDRRVPEQRSPRCDRTRLARGRGSGVVKPAPPSDGPRPRRREDGSLGPARSRPSTRARVSRRSQRHECRC